MRVMFLLVALAAFVSKSEAQWDRNTLNRTQWLVPNFNRTQPNPPSINKTQLNLPTFNRTQWITPRLNRTQSNLPTFNRTQWNKPTFSRTQWNIQTFNRSQNLAQWKLDAIDRAQISAKNRTNGRLQALNNTLWNGSSPNRTQWNTRTRRDTKWVAPAAVPSWNQTTHNGDLIIGQVGYLDRLLFNGTYKKESRWWSSREKIIEYPHDLPGKYNFNRQETITAVRIYNKFLDGLEAKAEILSGGVGYRYAKIRLSSPWNKGFQYLVQLYGH